MGSVRPLLSVVRDSATYSGALIHWLIAHRHAHIGLSSRRRAAIVKVVISTSALALIVAIIERHPRRIFR
jgi:hypothetical protein